jgi:hypothetical protein
MAYFPDLSRYSYGSDDDGDYSDYANAEGDEDERIENGRLDLNVGWLEREHDFARGDVPDGFVTALLRCAMRPVRMYRGLHACDLCPTASPVSERVVTMDFDGREVLLGNGEIRVCGPDGGGYTAPTLVVHYVAEHAYLPPLPFIEGVMARASAIYVVSGDQLRRLRAMCIADQFEVCLRAFTALPTRRQDVVEVLLRRIRAVFSGDPEGEPWRLGREVKVVPELDLVESRIAVAYFSILGEFPDGELTEHRTEQQRQDRANNCLIWLLERCADFGVDVTTWI